MEMCRVAKYGLILKDHIADTWGDRLLLTIMDWAGNRGYGTPLPYNFLTTKEWSSLFDEMGLRHVEHSTRLNLYPPYFFGFLDRQLHFLAHLDKNPHG